MHPSASDTVTESKGGILFPANKLDLLPLEPKLQLSPRAPSFCQITIIWPCKRYMTALVSALSWKMDVRACMFMSCADVQRKSVVVNACVTVSYWQDIKKKDEEESK